MERQVRPLLSERMSPVMLLATRKIAVRVRRRDDRPLGRRVVHDRRARARPALPPRAGEEEVPRRGAEHQLLGLLRADGGPGQAARLEAAVLERPGVAAVSGVVETRRRAHVEAVRARGVEGERGDAVEAEAVALDRQARPGHPAVDALPEAVRRSEKEHIRVGRRTGQALEEAGARVVALPGVASVWCSSRRTRSGKSSTTRTTSRGFDSRGQGDRSTASFTNVSPTWTQLWPPSWVRQVTETSALEASRPVSVAYMTWGFEAATARLPRSLKAVSGPPHRVPRVAQVAPSSVRGDEGPVRPALVPGQVDGAGSRIEVDRVHRRVLQGLVSIQPLAAPSRRRTALGRSSVRPRPSRWSGLTASHFAQLLYSGVWKPALTEICTHVSPLSWLSKTWFWDPSNVFSVEAKRCVTSRGSTTTWFTVVSR